MRTMQCFNGSIRALSRNAREGRRPRINECRWVFVCWKIAVRGLRPRKENCPYVASSWVLEQSMTVPVGPAGGGRSPFIVVWNRHKGLPRAFYGTQRVTAGILLNTIGGHKGLRGYFIGHDGWTQRVTAIILWADK